MKEQKAAGPREIVLTEEVLLTGGVWVDAGPDPKRPRPRTEGQDGSYTIVTYLGETPSGSTRTRTDTYRVTGLGYVSKTWRIMNTRGTEDGLMSERVAKESSEFSVGSHGRLAFSNDGDLVGLRFTRKVNSVQLAQIGFQK